MDKNDFNNLIKDIEINLNINIPKDKKYMDKINSLDMIERLRVVYNMLSDMAYNKDKPQTSEIKNTNMESSPPCSISKLGYKTYIDRKIEKLISAIWHTIEAWSAG